MDFYFSDRKLIIEVDGDYWHAKPKVAAKDRQKDGWMFRNGYKIVRIRESAVRNSDFSQIEAAL